MPDQTDRDLLSGELICAGEIEVSGEGLDLIDQPSDTGGCRSYGPDDVESDLRRLNGCYAALPSPFCRSSDPAWNSTRRWRATASARRST